MKIIHTDIYGNLPEILVNEARHIINNGKKIFYIVPSSLSFEKEKEILTLFNNNNDIALFDLIVTRLKQLPWYFDKGNETQLTNLSNIGLAMLMRQTLKNLSNEDLPTYRFMRDKQGFINQLVDLYHELTAANLTTDDLILAVDNQKNKELKIIFDAFDYQLNHFSNDNKLQQFIDKLVNDKLTQSLQDYVLIIEGYSRFSAEELSLIDALHCKVSEIIMGVYVSKKALSTSFVAGNVYQQSVELIHELSQKYPLTLIDKSVVGVDTTFTRVSNLIEKESDFTISNTDYLSNYDGLEIWQIVNHKEEIEHVAKKIRQLLYQGVKYQNILVLLGDISADAVLLPEIFKIYAIPFFYAQEKSMKDHPLIVLVEALVKIKNNHYQLNDILNLLKTQLYTNEHVNLHDVYKFEYYSLQHNIKGKKQFNQIFEVSNAEKVRSYLVGKNTPLQNFLESKPQKGSVWIQKFQDFLEYGQIKKNMEERYFQAEKNGEFEKSSENLEVWKHLLTIFEEFLAVFRLEKLSIVEFLEIIESGIQNATYRLVPANVDTVQIKSYELVEPQSADYFFDIGLTQANFPQTKKNTSLLSDEERSNINNHLRNSDVLKFIDEPTFTNHKKNDFTALQLFNAAKQKLILSTPLLYANEQSDQSQYLKFLIDRGVKPITKYGVNLNETIEQIGNYDGLLSNLGQIERLLMKDLNSTKIPFWSSLFRMMAKHSDYQRVLLSVQSDSLQERRLESSVISALYPTDLNASVSSFEKFYNCEYQYFLSQTLHLQEFERIDLDSRISGSYFHEVFEILMRNSNKTSEEFDSKLTRSLHEVDNKYLSFFTRDATSRYTWTKLQEIIKQTATLLKQTVNHSAIHSLAFEQGFGFEQSGIETYQVALQDDKNLKLRGMIDRVDQIFNTLGAIDYKSGNKKFDLQAVYEGVSLQFLTYLAILRKNAVKFNTEPTIWGALYLRLQNPIISLSGINQTREISSELKKIMKYTGFFNTEFASDFEDYFSDLFNLGQFTKEGIPFKNNHYFYTETEISSLINHNEALYQTAGQKILSGKIAINPVAIKHHVKGCQFCHFKSICGFEADNHFLSARKINTKSREEIKQLLLAGGTENASSK